jgi:hypothetical protein
MRIARHNPTLQAWFESNGVRLAALWFMPSPILLDRMRLWQMPTYPSAIVFGSFVLLACAGILAKGWIAPPKPVDPTNPTEVPRGGSFCDPPLPVQSTLEKPK